jgi:exopolysaccharide production protein ExoQ
MAVWVPTAWLMINGSRQVSQWFDSGSLFGVQRLEEGSQIDQVVYSLLILAGLMVLVKRRVEVTAIVANNLPIVLFILYAGISVLWSEVPSIALRRWIKALGDPVMILVLWSEPFPARAITATIKRCAYVLIPLSVLFCKYYENLGRTFSEWGGSSYTGVTTDKNMLGYLLFAYGLFFVAALMVARPVLAPDNKRRNRSERVVQLVLLVMIGWLFMIANSKTATLALAAGVIVVLALRLATVRKHFWVYTIALIVLITASDALFAITGTVAEASGRDATFTGRTGLWETVLREPINPLIGVGYASFWLGERLTRFWAMYPTSPPIQAHNGYLEVYLNLGLIGVILLISVLWTGLRRLRRAFAFSADGGVDARVLSAYGLAYGMAFLLYNITEATFYGLNTLFIIFLILSFDYPRKPESRSDRITRKPAMRSFTTNRPSQVERQQVHRRASTTERGSAWR